MTLEEVHARENIQANGSSGQGMAAFNKLIAAMESTKTQQEGKKEVYMSISNLIVLMGKSLVLNLSLCNFIVLLMSLNNFIKQT